MYSYGNDTPIGSSVQAYLESQSLLRNQVVTYIPRTPKQDASMINFYSQFPGMNSVGKVDNCAARTSEAFHAGGIPVEGSISRVNFHANSLLYRALSSSLFRKEGRFHRLC